MINTIKAILTALFLTVITTIFIAQDANAFGSRGYDLPTVEDTIRAQKRMIEQLNIQGAINFQADIERGNQILEQINKDVEERMRREEEEKLVRVWSDKANDYIVVPNKLAPYID